MDFPATLRYTKEHEWIRVGADGETATIGITDYAQSELGDIVFIELEPVGQAFDKDEAFGSVEAVKAVSDLFMPISGTITAHNEALEDHPERVNEDPYGEGWMIKVALSDPAELDGLLSADDYAAMVG
jgi:glycine cleavage system H protein